MLLKIVLLLILIKLLVLRWVQRKKIQCFKQFKNDIFSLPLIGHAYMMMGNGEVKMKAFQALGREAIKQGGVTTMQSWILGFFYAIVADAEVAEIILRNCLEKDDTMKMFKSVFGNGILVAPVPEWRQRRKVLNPAFNSKNLNQYAEIFRKNSTVLSNKLKEIAKAGPFSIYDHITAYSLDSVFVNRHIQRLITRAAAFGKKINDADDLNKDIVSTTATSLPRVNDKKCIIIQFIFPSESMYGFEVGAQKNPQHPVMKALSICCDLVSNRICLPWLHNQTVYEMTSQFAALNHNADLLFSFIDEKIIQKCKDIKKNASDQMPNDSKKTKTILQLMLESSNKNNETLTKLYLREETFLVTFAATDTTSIALSFTCVMLARHPYVQERVYQEIMQVLGDSEQPIEAEDLPRLKYTEAVIKETLRMFPPGPLVLRKMDKDIELPSGKTLVAGTGVVINVWAVHHNPLYWDEPEQFRPERFLDSTLKHPAAFLPFSYGVRNCIGSQFAMMSMKTTLSSLIRQYKVLPANDDPKATLEPIRVQFDIMMRDAENFTVQLVTRR